ncbi:MAG: trimethylamine methyltransferase family protein, partial [Candidatus Marinimicrobia bacterium]|nr:trimethylamine methyltransferase family protein [Candidatus Neomarinimicrobiota bacterium]
MRPTIEFLGKNLIQQIVSEAYQILCTLGIEIHNKNVLAMFSDHGAKVDVDKSLVIFKEDIIQKALKSAPKSFKLYDVNGNETNDFSGYNVHFTPGSTSINVLDCKTKQIRKP